MLAEVLEDGQITPEEAAALADLAALYEMGPDDIAATHRGFLLALAHQALDDGRVSQAERAELVAVAALLNLDEKLVRHVVDAADAARQTRLSQGLAPLPADWTLGEPLGSGTGSSSPAAMTPTVNGWSFPANGSAYE